MNTSENPFDQRPASSAIRSAVSLRILRAGRRSFILLACAVFSCCAVPVTGAIQNSGSTRWQMPDATNIPGMEQMDPEMARRQLRALNEERQKAIVKDTARLLKIAQELNAETQNAASDDLTQAQWKQVNRIQKLARGVRQKMILTYGGVPVFRPPVPTTMP
ncbi:MAG TPA: hypothetical protein VGR64_01570 [Terracidiphilus sp.]|nr:hypothetical protein [Terracidiphilus sp.]